MADSPPVTRKRGKQNDGERTSARDRRYGYNDWRDAAESERVLVDKRKKLLRAIPTSIPGVTGILKGQAKRDLREMGAFVDMKVLDAEEVAPGGVMVTPRPLIPKANQLEAKQARLARWEKDPSLIEKDMADRREAVSRAEEKDLRMKAQQEAWERGYLSHRAHLMARRRPTASWSRTVEATSSSNTSAPAGGASATIGSPVPVAGETEAALEEGDGRASAVGGGEGPDGGNMKGNGNGGNIAVVTGSNGRRREGEGGALGGIDAAGTGVAVWSCEGEEEEEEASLRELERVVMNRAGLEGEFDMMKVIDVLTDRSRQVMSARREHACLLAQQQQHDQNQKENGDDEAKRDLDKVHPHPGDMALLGRWQELLRSTDLVGEGRRPPDGMDDAYHEACDSDETLLRTKSATLLIPRGLDLVPSMRAPRYPTLLQQLVQHQQQERQEEEEEEEEATNAKETSRKGSNASNAIEMEVEGRKSGPALTVVARMARAMECVPWIGIEDGGGTAGVQGVPTVVAAVDARTEDPESAQTIAGVKGSIGERVQWFPRGLPMEMAKSEGGYDERQSAYYVSKTSQALDRLKNLMKETAKRQEEMELRRRLKAKEALGLVRAVADHEKLRQEHLKRMKSLRKQLEMLEGAKGSLSSDAEEPAGVGDNGDPEASDSEMSSTTRAADEGDRGNDPASPKVASTSATNAVSPTARVTATASAADAAGATSTSPLGVTVATTRSRSPSSPRALMTMPTPTSPPGKKGKGRGKCREADAKGGESLPGHQQNQQTVRGSRKGEEEVASATSSTSPTSPPSSSSPCPSPSPGLEKTPGVAAVAAPVGSDEALSKDDGSRIVERGSEGGGVRECDDGDDEKGDNSSSDSKDPPVEDSFEAVASDSRKRALGGEAGSGVVVRGPSKRRRSADVVMAMSVNDDSGTGRNASAVNGETSGASLLSTRHTGVQVSTAAGSKSKGNGTVMTPLSSGGGKSKTKAATSGRRASSTRQGQGSRGRWGGRR